MEEEEEEVMAVFCFSFFFSAEVRGGNGGCDVIG